MNFSYSSPLPFNHHSLKIIKHILQDQAKKFNRVLVDAPSSGVGIVRLTPGQRMCRTAGELNYISTRQKQLLLYGADCVKQSTLQDSYLVYTTCSTLVT